MAYQSINNNNLSRIQVITLTLIHNVALSTVGTEGIPGTITWCSHADEEMPL